MHGKEHGTRAPNGSLASPIQAKEATMRRINAPGRDIPGSQAMKPSIAWLATLALLLSGALATGCRSLPAHPAPSGGTQASPPLARSVPATDVYPGFEVVDPYRNLENLDDPDTQAWMRAQADHGRAVLDAIPERAAIRAALDEADALRAYTVGRIVRTTAQRTFYMRREANAPISRLYVRDGDSGAGRVVFDPSAFDSQGQTHAVSWYVPSPSGKRVAVGIAANGSEMAEFHVLDVDSGEQLEGPIPRSWLGIVTWLDEERMLLGRTRETTPDTPPAEAWLDSQVYLHRIGTPIGEDAHIFGTQSAQRPSGLSAEQFVGVQLRSGEPYALALGANSAPHMSAWVLPAADLGKPDARWRLIFLQDAGNRFGGDVRDGQFYVISTRSPNGEIVRYDLASGERHVVRAAAERPIENLGVARDGLYFRERQGVYTTLKRIGFDGAGETAIRFPRKGNPEPANQSYTHPGLDGAVVYLESWTEPDTVFRVGADGTAEAMGLDAPAAGIDTSRLHVQDLAATSHDGTRVPMTLLHHDALHPAGEQPVLLIGYGSYGMSMDPSFTPTWLAMQRQGLAMAICHVRGGGEFGSAWHEAGRLANKANTWKDFIACAEALVAQGITVPEKLVGMGTSAGGITITNAVAARPELFAGAVNDVGVSDVLRSLSASRNGPNHYAENGDIRTPEGAAIARASSGYEKMEAGKPYPRWLVIHGVNDPRVEVWQSSKFVARMQAASRKPVIYRLDYAAGHGMGSSADARKDWAADITAFVLEATRDRAGPGIGAP